MSWSVSAQGGRRRHAHVRGRRRKPVLPRRLTPTVNKVGFVDKTDCLIVGAGPAGLTAAIYLARFRLSVAVIDSGRSRAALIPCTRNQAGFPDGIAGVDLLARMRRHAAGFGVAVWSGQVPAVHRHGDLFVADGTGMPVQARTVLLATGVTNRRPDMPDNVHNTALAQGRLRYCPVCDGFEITDQRVAVIGTGARGLKEAEFLRSYTRDVTLVASDSPHSLSTAERQRLAAIGVPAIDGPARDFELTEHGLGFLSAAGRLV